MTLGIRKLVVIGIIGLVFLAANALVLAQWLNEMGATGWAASIRREFLSGTAITVIVALLILLVPTRHVSGRTFTWIRRCPICDHRLPRKGRYCPECGPSLANEVGQAH